MPYINALKGGTLFFILFTLLVFVLPVVDAGSGIEAAFGAGTFVFAILSGFFLSRFGGRYSAMGDLIAQEDAGWFTVYQSARVLNEKILKKFVEIIDEYYRRAYDLNIGTSYKATTKQMRDAYTLLKDSGSNDFNKVELHAINSIFRSLGNIEKARNTATRTEEERMTLGMWVVLLALAFVVVVGIYMLRDGSFMFNVATILFSTAVTVVLLLIRDMHEFKMGGAMLAEESGQEIFETIGKLRYYHEDYFKNGLIQIPSHVKEYRLAKHQAGEKEEIEVVTV